MQEDTVTESPENPEPTPAPAPPAPAPAATVEPPAPAPASAPAVETPAPVPSATKRGAVQVPVWLLVVVAIVVVGVGAFFVGRSTAPDSGDSGPKTLAEAVEMTAAGDMEVGDFNARDLLQALRQNNDLDLGTIGDLILGEGNR
jgi:hypothetical protein